MPSKQEAILRKLQKRGLVRPWQLKVARILWPEGVLPTTPLSLFWIIPGTLIAITSYWMGLGSGVVELPLVLLNVWWVAREITYRWVEAGASEIDYIRYTLLEPDFVAWGELVASWCKDRPLVMEDWEVLVLAQGQLRKLSENPSKRTLSLPRWRGF